MAPRLSRHSSRARHPRWTGLIETRAMIRNSFASACSISLFRVREIPRRMQSRTIRKTPAKLAKTDTAVIVMRGLSHDAFDAPYREIRQDKPQGISIPRALNLKRAGARG